MGYITANMVETFYNSGNHEYMIEDYYTEIKEANITDNEIEFFFKNKETVLP